MIIKYKLVRPNAKVPSKRNEDAGYDLYAAIDEAFLDTHCGFWINNCYVPKRARLDVADGETVIK